MRATIIPGMPRVRKLVALMILVMALAVWTAWPYTGAAAFVFDVAGVSQPIREFVPIGRRTVSWADETLPTRHGPVGGRVYTPSGSVRGSVIVFPGVHRGGPDEPRLDALAQRLSGTGFRVLSVPLPGLREFRVTSESTDIIEDATRWMADTPRLAPDGHVGLVGVSFAGGLALVAAGRPSLQDRLEAVLSIGGHGDLPRALRYLCTGSLPDGAQRPPHDYGLAVLALTAVPLLVPPSQQPSLARGITAFLDASHDESAEQVEGRNFLAAARAEVRTLDEPGRSILHAVIERKVDELGPRLIPFVDRVGGDPALSPERSPITRAPVFLLHGMDDNVIPAAETTALAGFLERAGHGEVRALLTPLLSHVGVSKPRGPGEVWDLIAF
jgi:dienelactone hydrolase